MKERKIASDISTAIISVFLSFALIFLMVFLCFYSSFQSVLQPKGLSNLAKNIGYAELMSDNAQIKNAFAGYGVNEQNASDFLTSKAVEDACALYSQDIFAALDGDVKSESKFTIKNVQSALAVNLDSMVDAVYNENSKAGDRITTEKRVVATIKKIDKKFINSVPSKKKLAKDAQNSDLWWILSTFNSSLKDIILIVIIIIIAAIFVLRFYKLGGFLWLSTAFLITTAVLATVMILCITGVMNYFFSMFIGNMASNAFVLVFSEGIISGCLLTFAVGIAMILVYVLLKKRFFKKENEITEIE